MEQWLGVHCVWECVVEQWLGVRRTMKEMEHNAFRISFAKHKFLCCSLFRINLSELHNIAKKAHTGVLLISP